MGPRVRISRLSPIFMLMKEQQFIKDRVEITEDAEDQIDPTLWIVVSGQTYEIE